LKAAFAGAHGAGFIARATGLIAVLLPALLPLLVYVGWMVRRLRRKEFDDQEKLAILLVLASFGFVISTYHVGRRTNSCLSRPFFTCWRDILSAGS